MKVFRSICATVLFISFATSANAGIFESFLAWVKSDQCSSLEGKWSGSGEIDKPVNFAYTVRCYYQGSGSFATDPVASTFRVQNGALSLDANKSSSVCPANPPLEFTGTCKNGQLSVNTDQFTLSGSMSGTSSLSLQGTANIAGYKGLVVKNISLQKN